MALGGNWSALAELANEHGNSALAAAVSKLPLNGYLIWKAISGLDAEVAISVAAKAVRRASVRSQDKASLAVVEAVEKGLRGNDIDGARNSALVSYRAAVDAAVDAYDCSLSKAAHSVSHAASIVNTATDSSASYAAYAASFAAESLYESCAEYDEECHNVCEASSCSQMEEELTAQIADIFEVWWDSVTNNRGQNEK